MKKLLPASLLALAVCGLSAAPSFAGHCFGLFTCGHCCKVCCTCCGTQYNAFSPICCEGCWPNCAPSHHAPEASIGFESYGFDGGGTDGCSADGCSGEGAIQEGTIIGDAGHQGAGQHGTIISSSPITSSPAVQPSMPATSGSGELLYPGMMPSTMMPSTTMPYSTMPSTTMPSTTMPSTPMPSGTPAPSRLSPTPEPIAPPLAR